MLIISSDTPKSSLNTDEFGMEDPVIVCDTMRGHCETFTGKQVRFMAYASTGSLNWNKLSTVGVPASSIAYDVPKKLKYWISSDDDLSKEKNWRAKINRFALAGVEPWGKYVPRQRSRVDAWYDYAWVLTDTRSASGTLGLRFTTPVRLGFVGESEFVKQFSENGYYCEYGSDTYILDTVEGALYTSSLAFGTDRVSHMQFEKALAMLIIGYVRGKINGTARGIVCYSPYYCFVVEDADFKTNTKDCVNIVCYTSTRAFYVARNVGVFFIQNEVFNVTSYNFDCSVPSPDDKHTIGEFMFYLLVNGALNKKIKSCNESDTAFIDTIQDIVYNLDGDK